MIKQDLVSMSDALLAVCLELCSLQALKYRAIKRSYKAMITWWLKSLSEWNGRNFCDPGPTMIIETDERVGGSMSRDQDRSML